VFKNLIGGFMENIDIDFGQTVSSGAVSMLVAGAILVLSVLIVAIIITAKRWKGRVIPLLLGLLSYVIFGFMFSQMFMSIIRLIPSVDMSFTYNSSSYIVVYNIVFAVGLAIARWFTVKLMADKYNRAGDVILAGTGIALGDAVMMYGLSVLSYYVYAQAISASGLQKVVEDMLSSGLSAEEVMTEYTANMAQLFNAPEPLWFIMGLATVLDIVLNIILCIVVYGSVKKQINYMLPYYAIIIQFVSNILFQVYNAYSLANIIILFTIKLVVVIGTILYTKQFIMKEIKYSDD
jgi:uncharacterized membrane protein YhfC